MTDLRAKLQATLGDAYTLERELGGGGMSRVFTANGGQMPALGVVAATLWELGEHDAAVALLDEGMRRYDGWINLYASTERFARMRKDPRAAAMLSKIEEW